MSKQDVDNAHGDFEAKKAMVASAESNVKRLEELQSFEKIYAPFDGVITARNTDVGHLINSGAGDSGRRSCFTWRRYALCAYTLMCRSSIRNRPSQGSWRT